MSFSTMRAGAWVADIKTQLAHIAPLLFTIATKGTLAAVAQDQEQKDQDEGLLERDVVHIQVLANGGVGQTRPGHSLELLSLTSPGNFVAKRCAAGCPQRYRWTGAERTGPPSNLFSLRGGMLQFQIFVYIVLPSDQRSAIDLKFRVRFGVLKFRV